MRAFRDYLRPDIGEILIDNAKIVDMARHHIEAIGRGDFASKIKYYSGDVPLLATIKSSHRSSPLFNVRFVYHPVVHWLLTPLRH